MSAAEQQHDPNQEPTPDLGGGGGHSAGGEDEGDSIWLISYADLMTLLFTFFVVMYAAATQSKGGNVQAMKESLSAYFGGGKHDSPFEKLQKAIIESVKNDKLLYDIETRATMNGLELTFSTTVLFSPGNADIVDDAIPAMKKLVGIIRANAPNNMVRVEGHTDDSPIASGKYPSNWELSSSRSATIIKLFEASGFEPKNLTSIGYSSTRPRYPNRGNDGKVILENRSKNRRVVVKIIQPKAFYEKNPATTEHE